MTVDDEIVKLRDLEQVTAIVATHQIRDAFYVATHEAARTADGVKVSTAAETKTSHAEFIVLHEGRIHFHGRAPDLLAAPDDYLKEFLFNTLPPW
jgi:phospholipid/cholesterol/gamma-HCH transport system ATP-binding protein